MSLHKLVSEITQFFSWLYYERQWKNWELIVIAAVALVILIILRGRRIAKARRMTAKQPDREKHWRGK
jgi:hypothetical protein